MVSSSTQDLSDNEIGTDGLDKLFQVGRITAKLHPERLSSLSFGDLEYWRLEVLRDHRVPCVVLKAYRNSVDEALQQRDGSENKWSKDVKGTLHVQNVD